MLRASPRFLALGSLVAGVVLCHRDASAQVRITEVNVTSNKVELTNFGATSVNLNTWLFCHRFTYPVVGGTLAPGQSRQFTVAFNKTSSDLGLYNSGSFSSTSAMQDFVQWGAGGIGRESVAVAKGIWSTGFFLAVPGSGNSLHLRATNSTGLRTTNWFVARPHEGYPLPAPVIQKTVLGGGRLRLTTSSFYLPAAHQVEVAGAVKDAPWLALTPQSVDLGGGLYEFSVPVAGRQQFARVRATP